MIKVLIVEPNPHTEEDSPIVYQECFDVVKKTFDEVKIDSFTTLITGSNWTEFRAESYSTLFHPYDYIVFCERWMGLSAAGEPSRLDYVLKVIDICKPKIIAFKDGTLED